MTTILIIDDASFMRNALKFILEKAGHSVVGMAKDGREGLEVYKELKADLVILDVLMPGMSGIDTLKEILNEDANALVIMIAALGQEQKEDEALALGAVGYIRKPFKQEQIISEVERALQGRKRVA